jgi:hypothetical protein
MEVILRLKRIALTLFACLALGAIAANAASAAEGDGWTIEGSGRIASGTHQGVSCSKHPGSSLIFATVLLGKEVQLEIEQVDCVEASIDNTTSNGHSEGKFRFTGVKVLKPSTKCSVKNVGGTLGTVTTEALTDQVIMDPFTGSTVVFDRFSPETAGGAFVTIEFAGSECPLNEASAPVKGTACGESPNKTGVLLATQVLTFGASQQTTGGCAMAVGNNAALLRGSIDFVLAGTNVGSAFGAD